MSFSGGSTATPSATASSSSLNTTIVARGVTTMGSDRENPGAPNLNGSNGGPQV